MSVRINFLNVCDSIIFICNIYKYIFIQVFTLKDPFHGCKKNLNIYQIAVELPVLLNNYANGYAKEESIVKKNFHVSSSKVL